MGVYGSLSIVRLESCCISASPLVSVFWVVSHVESCAFRSPKM